MPKKNPSQSRGPKPRSSQSTSPQATLEESFPSSQRANAENLEDNVSKVVRYVIYKAGSNLPIKKTDIQRNVLPNIGRSYEAVMKLAIEVLKDVYGYELHLCDQSASNKQYIVRNVLPFTDMSVENKEVPDDVKKILVLLVLTHIFMSNGSVNEDAIFRFLQSLKIDPYERHPIFGNVREFVTFEMVRQKYLVVETDQHSRRNSYSWGPKAEVEVSKHKVLNFVCKIYGDRLPRTWTRQFELANEQSLENGEEAIVENGTANHNGIQDERMEVENSHDDEDE